MNHYDILKAIKTGYAPDHYTALYARSMSGSKEYERFISGELPLILSDSVGKPLVNWSITGNTVQDGEPTPEQPIEVKGTGDKTGNLFERIIKETNISATGVVATGESAKDFDLFIAKVKRNTEYTISEKVSHTHVIGFFKDDVAIRSVTYNQSRTVTTGEKSYSFTTPDADINYVAIRFASNSSNIMLNEGSKPLPYEPYGYKVPVVSKVDGQEITTPIYLNSPLMDGETLDSAGKREKEWGEYEFTGNEAFVAYTNFNAKHSFRVFGIGATGTQIKCSHFVNQSILSDFINVGDSATHTEGGGIYFRYNIFDDVSSFKSFLKSEYDAGTPVTIYYQLATPTSETVDVPQIPTLKGNNVIDINTEVQPKNVSITYLSSGFEPQPLKTADGQILYTNNNQPLNTLE